MLVVGANLEEINNLKKQLLCKFEMKDLGAAKQILGMRISRDEQGGTLQLSQAEYIRKVLQRFCRNPTLAKCGGEAQHLEKLGFGVLRDSRMFRAGQ
jgi:hypothetical protein